MSVMAAAGLGDGKTRASEVGVLGCEFGLEPAGVFLFEGCEFLVKRFHLRIVRDGGEPLVIVQGTALSSGGNFEGDAARGARTSGFDRGDDVGDFEAGHFDEIPNVFLGYAGVHRAVALQVACAQDDAVLAFGAIVVLLPVAWVIGAGFKTQISLLTGQFRLLTHARQFR